MENKVFPNQHILNQKVKTEQSQFMFLKNCQTHIFELFLVLENLVLQ